MISPDLELAQRVLALRGMRLFSTAKCFVATLLAMTLASMRALIQRVSRASVVVDGKVVSQIGAGLLLFLGVCKEDTQADMEPLLSKIPQLRVFDDANGRMNISAMEKGAEFLVISQFTLYGNCQKGRRPSFDRAAPSGKAHVLYDQFVQRLKAQCPRVQEGVFGATMKVSLENDGPVTLWMDSRA